MNDVKQSVDVLNHLLANSQLLGLNTQYGHWNVTGPNFYSLHLLFEEQYKDMQAATDEIAERIRALGAMAPASWQQYSSLASVQATADEQGEQAIIAMLKNGHESILASIHQAIKALADDGDDVTTDILIGRAAFHDKALWMLRSL